MSSDQPVESLTQGQGFLVLARTRSAVVGYAFVLLEDGSDDTFRLGERLRRAVFAVGGARLAPAGRGDVVARFRRRELASRGIHDLRVAVMVGNVGAQRLYERSGLQPAETILYRFGEK